MNGAERMLAEGLRHPRPGMYTRVSAHGYRPGERRGAMAVPA